MKVFISQPMAGKSDEKIIEIKNESVAKFTKYLENKKGKKTIEVIDTFFQDYDGNPMQFLGKAITEGLALADVAIFSPGWFDSRGCKIEHEVAVAYGLPIFYINEL